MRLTSVNKGDIVRVAGSYALVVDKPGRGKLAITWLGRENGGPRPARAAEVEAHWRRSKAS